VQEILEGIDIHLPLMQQHVRQLLDDFWEA
jgi:hypothetical protein